MDKQHEARMMSLAGEAFQCWKQEGHPGWLLDDRDSSILDEMHQREVRLSTPVNKRVAHSCVRQQYSQHLEHAVTV